MIDKCSALKEHQETNSLPWELSGYLSSPKDHVIAHGDHTLHYKN